MHQNQRRCKVCDLRSYASRINGLSKFIKMLFTTSIYVSDEDHAEIELNKYNERFKPIYRTRSYRGHSIELPCLEVNDMLHHIQNCDKSIFKTLHLRCNRLNNCMRHIMNQMNIINRKLVDESVSDELGMKLIDELHSLTMSYGKLNNEHVKIVSNIQRLNGYKGKRT